MSKNFLILVPLKRVSICFWEITFFQMTKVEFKIEGEICFHQIALEPFLYKCHARNYYSDFGISFQKQPFRRALSERCSENMLQIYRRTPMPKCDFNKVVKQLRHGCSPVNLLHIFRTPSTKNTCGWLPQTSRVYFAQMVQYSALLFFVEPYKRKLNIFICYLTKTSRKQVIFKIKWWPCIIYWVS